MKDLFIVPDHMKLSHADFNDVVEDQIRHIRKTLASKQQEYAAGEDDAMHNFNVAMAIEQAGTNSTKTREDTIWDMAKKHYVSIMDMRVDLMLGRPTKKITTPYLNEKFGDMINYFILLKASFIQTLKLPIPVALDTPISTSNADTVRGSALSLNYIPLKPSYACYKPGYGGIPSSWPSSEPETHDHWIEKLANFLGFSVEMVHHFTAVLIVEDGVPKIQFYSPWESVPRSTKTEKELMDADISFNHS